MQVAIYTIFSWKHFSLQVWPVSINGQFGLAHVSLGNGLFLLIPCIIGGPGLSTTLTLVPGGPVTFSRTDLTLLASSEFRVDGTTKVAVVPSALNQSALSDFL